MTDYRLTLDGEWEFLHVVEDYRSRPVQWRNITVPGPWQAQFADLRMRTGTGIYRKEIVIPSGWLTDRAFLTFNAVFHITKVWLNGSFVGSHIGGFLPFTFDVTDNLREGANELKVRVDGPSDDPDLFPEAPFAEIPYGKQSWYGPLSGIWQSVWVERRISDHLSRIRIDADLDTGKVTTQLFFATALRADTDVEIHITDPDGTKIIAAQIALKRTEREREISFPLGSVMPWSPRSPKLYRMHITLLRGENVIDELQDDFGFRKIETRGGQFYLNGERFYLRAALDQDYYPEMICTPPSIAFLEDQLRKAKELGLNCLRCHIKAPDPRYYEVADRLGMLIWTELPNMGAATDRSRNWKEETLKGIVDRDCNHPSIICWTIINENWGVDLVHDHEHRQWLRETYRWLKNYDPGRLVVDNSPLAPSFHIETDIADFHYYAAFPDSRGDWDRFVDEFATRPPWLFSPTDGKQTAQEPLVCSEFGNWGLPDPDLLKDNLGNEPWWFETGHDWADGVTYAHGIENRFADWSLGRTFASLASFIEAAQWQQFRALKYSIEFIRSKAAISGYVITELSDTHWESNGLLDMRRNPRVFHHQFASINSATILIAKWSRLSFWSNERATFEILVARGDDRNLSDLTLKVLGGEEVLLTMNPISTAESPVHSMGEISIVLPEVFESRMLSVQFQITDNSGAVIAANSLAVSLHPLPQKSQEGPKIWASDLAIRNSLNELGYHTVDSAEPDALWVAIHADGGADHVRQGGRMLLFPRSEVSLTPFFPHWQNVHVRDRLGTLWKGDWVSSFSWLRRGHAFRALPGGPLLDESFDRVLPTRIIIGCNLLDFQARVHGALVLGWIHKPVALTVERGYGKGRIVVSTFNLFRDPPGSDPTATVLLRSLIELATAQGSAAHREQEQVLDNLE